MAKLNHTSRRRRPLRVLRAERDLTQGMIATRAALTQTRYWQIEHGEGAPLRAEEQATIARVLGVAPHAIAWPPRQLTALQQAAPRAGSNGDGPRPG